MGGLYVHVWLTGTEKNGKQAYLRFVNIPFRPVPSNNHASSTGSLPFLLPADNGSVGDTVAGPQPVPTHRLQKWAIEQEHVEEEQQLNARFDVYASLVDSCIRSAWVCDSNRPTDKLPPAPFSPFPSPLPSRLTQEKNQILTLAAPLPFPALYLLSRPRQFPLHRPPPLHRARHHHRPRPLRARPPPAECRSRPTANPHRLLLPDLFSSGLVIGPALHRFGRHRLQRHRRARRAVDVVGE